MARSAARQVVSRLFEGFQTRRHVGSDWSEMMPPIGKEVRPRFAAGRGHQPPCIRSPAGPAASSSVSRHTPTDHDIVGIVRDRAGDGATLQPKRGPSPPPRPDALCRSMQAILRMSASVSVTAAPRPRPADRLNTVTNLTVEDLEWPGRHWPVRSRNESRSSAPRASNRQEMGGPLAEGRPPPLALGGDDAFPWNMVASMVTASKSEKILDTPHNGCDRADPSSRHSRLIPVASR